MKSQLDFEPILCPQCNIRTAIIFNFGKKARCTNCNHIWSLRWKGGNIFSNKVRLQNV